MKCIILAAGYATRLYPLTKNFPKPLLKVAGKTIVDYLVDDLKADGRVDSFVVVTNHKFAEIFRTWAPKGVSIVDDGTSTNEDRLGAVRDLQYALATTSCPHDKAGECKLAGQSSEDVLVLAADNILDFSLSSFLDYAQQKGTSCIMRYHEPDEVKCRRSGIIEIDSDARVLSMEEKPSEPKSHWCCPPFYFYKSSDIALLGEALQGGCSADAPGSFAAWLSGHRPVYAYQMPSSRYDIGNLQGYEAVCKLFEQRSSL